MAQLGRLSFFAGRSSFLSLWRSSVVVSQRFSSSTAPAPASPIYKNCLPTQNQNIGSNNGLNVASEKLPNSHFATVGLFVDAGSSLENDTNNGVSNLLQYLASNASVKRTGKSVAEELDNIGGRLNIETGREKTVILAQVAPDDIERAVEVLASIVDNFNSFSSTEQLERAKRRVLRILENNNDPINASAFEHLHSIAFQTSSLGLPQKGSIKSVRNLTTDCVSDFVSRFFTRERMVVAGAGDFEHNQLSKLVGNYFSSVSSGNNRPSSETNQPFIGSAVTIHDDSSEDVHITIGFQGANWTSDNYFALQLIQVLVGSYNDYAGVSSYSSTRVAELLGEERLASDFAPFNISYKSTGVIGFQAATIKHNLEDVIAEGIMEYVRLAQNARPAEVERAKIQLQGQIRKAYDCSLSICRSLGTQVLTTGNTLSLEDQLKAVNDLDVSNVRTVATNTFTDVEPVVVGIGNTLEIPDYNQVRGWTNWWRM